MSRRRGPRGRPGRTRPRPSRAAILVAGLLAGAALPPAAPGQAHRDGGASGHRPAAEFAASAYLPLGHWAYPVLERWVAAGRIRSLSPLVKPWRRADVARALARIRTSGLGSAERERLERLRRELGPETRSARTGRIEGRLRAGGTWTSQTHRDPLRPELDGEFSDAALLEHADLEAHGAAGVLAGGFRVARDGIYTEDPQFPGGRVVPRTEFPGLDESKLRVEEGYAELQTRYVRLFFGRMYRNWGLPGLPGFLRSDHAYSEEEIGYRFGTERIFLIGSFASYGDFRGDTTHYVALHRLEARPVDRLVIAVSEASVHGGPGRSVDFRLVNPISIWQFQREDGDPPHNKVGQLDVWWRAADGLVAWGSLLADATNEQGSCCQMGGTLGVELPTLAPGLGVRASLTAIQSLAYRTRLPWEEYSVEDIGLGWDKVDLYLGRVEADWLLAGGLRLRPRLDVQARGEGDFRELRPEGDPETNLSEFPRILLGETELTVRPSLAGRWTGGGRWGVDVSWDLGWNAIQDYRNVEGDDRDEFVGRLTVHLLTPALGIPLR